MAILRELAGMGIFDRWRRETTPPDPAPAPEPSPATGGVDQVSPGPANTRAESASTRTEPANASADPAYESLAEWIHELLRPGFATEEEVRERVTEMVADDEDWAELREEQVEAALEQVLADIRAEQAGWPDEGDATAVLRAFEAIGRQGIISRMSFTCCNTCGHAEIGDSVGADTARGYVFFHEQDAGRLAPGGSELSLSYGGFERAGLVDRSADQDSIRAALAARDRGIAEDAVALLRAEGLTVDWDGAATSRIRVCDLDWRRKLPTQT